MKSRFGIGLFVLFCFTACQQSFAADIRPESLLPADTAVYLRFSSWSYLREAYNGTALSEVMRGDLGRFLGSLAAWGRNSLEETLKKELPDDPRVALFWDNLDRSGQQLLEHGALLGVQLRTGKDPCQFTLVFPEGSKDGARGAVQKFMEDGVKGALQKVMEDDAAFNGGSRSLGTVKLGNFKHGRRNVSFVDFGEKGSWAWWSEEGHFVVASCSDPVEALLKRLKKKSAGNLTQNALYKKLTASQSYPTLLSGFVDARSMIEYCVPSAGSKEETEQERAHLKDLGIFDMQGLTFRCGFEGKAWRESYALHLDPQRRGIWQLLDAAENVNVDQLPALPADAAHVTVASLNTGRLSIVVNKWFDSYQKANPVDKELAVVTVAVKEIIKQLLEPLGPQVVWFNSPSEGGFLLDQALAIQVKDAVALNDLLRLLQVGQKFQSLLGDKEHPVLGGYSLKKHSYRGVDYFTVEGAPIVASFVVHEGWLVLGCNPQIVQGYILRTRNEAPRWQPAPELRRALAAPFRNEERAPDKEVRILAMSQQDTRELTRWGLSYAPWLGPYMQAASDILTSNGVALPDPTKIPNAHAVIGQLFPNVNLLVDDGQALRWEKHASLPIGHIMTAYMGCCAFVLAGDASWPDLSCWVPAAKKTDSPKRAQAPEVTKAAPPTPGTTVPFSPASPLTDVVPAGYGQFQSTPASDADKQDAKVIKVYDIAGILDLKNLERSKAELQDSLYLTAPKAWDEGREPGSLPIVILSHQNRLIVRQTPEVHQRIERLLADLKASLAKAPVSEP